MARFSVNAWQFSLTVGVGRWDRFTSWGTKLKDGSETVFNAETLGQMVENFAKRKNDIAMCFDHQSAYVAENGQPAPALAWYSALALIVDGKVAKFASHAANVQPPDPAGLENGVYGYRAEITPLGEKLLPNYKYISPMFTDAGDDEKGNPVGYDLIDVAATNTPFQDGVGLTFHRTKPHTFGGAMDPEMMKKLGLGEKASPEECMAALKARFQKYEDDEAELKKQMKKMSDDGDAKKMADNPDDKEKMSKEDEEAKKEMGKQFGIDPGALTFSKLRDHLAVKMVGADQVATMAREIESLKKRDADREAADKQSKAKLFANDAIAKFRITEDKRGIVEKTHVAEGEAEAEKLLFPVNTFSALKVITSRGNPDGKDPTPTRFTTDNSGRVGVEFDKAVKSLMSKNPKLTYGEAMDQVNAEQPHLYSRTAG